MLTATLRCRVIRATLPDLPDRVLRPMPRPHIHTVLLHLVAALLANVRPAPRALLRSVVSERLTIVSLDLAVAS